MSGARWLPSTAIPRQRVIKRQYTILSLNTELNNGDGIELIDTVADDKAIDLDAWIDARTWLLGCPSRLVQIASKRVKSLLLEPKEKMYLQRLRQLSGNLVDNAIRYTTDESTITLSRYRERQWARLEVADTGVGIAPEHLPHIFDRFYRVDKARSRVNGGTGLGLAIVKGIAEQHKGKVIVTSEFGKGSTFPVWLKF